MPSPVFFALFILAATVYYSDGSSTTVGVEFHPSYTTSSVIAFQACQLIGITVVKIENPTPASISAFSGREITLILSLPSEKINPFLSQNSVNHWVATNIQPFIQLVNISMISLGKDVHSSLTNKTIHPKFLVGAMRNLHQALSLIGAEFIKVSSVISFDRVILHPFPPSQSIFIPSFLDSFLNSLLQFLEETHSPIFINISPFKLYSSVPEMPIGYAIMEPGSLNFRQDKVTGERYDSLFQEMLASSFMAISSAGFEKLNIIVGCGWPTSGVDASAYAESFYTNIIAYSKMDGVQKPSTIILHELFDPPIRGGGVSAEDADADFEANFQWGLFLPNLTLKLDLRLKGSELSNICFILTIGGCMTCVAVAVAVYGGGGLLGIRNSLPLPTFCNRIFRV